MAGHSQRTATCLFFLSLFKLKRSETSPRCELFNPRVVVPPPSTRLLGPLNSVGGFCATVKTIQKKKSILGGVESFYMDVLCMLCRGEHTFSACSFYFSGPGDPLSPQLLHRPLPLPHLCFQL